MADDHLWSQWDCQSHFLPWVIIIGCSTKHIFQDKEKVIMRGCVRDTKGS